jgi:hypothetical protein
VKIPPFPTPPSSSQNGSRRIPGKVSTDDVSIEIDFQAVETARNENSPLKKKGTSYAKTYLK